MEVRLPDLIQPFREDRITNCSYELSTGPQAYVTGTDSRVRQYLDEGQQFDIPPGQFAQVLTEEFVEVPPDSLALISMKSGPKIRGLVNVSGFHVDPGYSGRLLFSVFNAGPEHIILERGQPTFLIWYAGLDVQTGDVYRGSRSGMASISANDIMKLQGDVASPQALAYRVDELERKIDLSTEVWKWILRTIIVTALIATIGFATDRINLAFNASDDSPASTTGAP